VVADPAQLPDDPALLKSMVAELLAALRHSQQETEHLQHRLDQLLRRLYGPRAERYDPNQPLLFPEPAATAAAETVVVATPAAEETASLSKRKGHGRQHLPPHLERRRRVHSLTEAERLCSCCGQPRQVISEEVTEQLEYEPASMYVVEHVRLVYACPGCQKQAATAQVSPPPSPAALVEVSPSVAVSEPPPVPVATTMATGEVTPPVAAAVEKPPESLAATVALPPGSVVRVPVSTFTTAAKPAQPIPRGLPGPGLLAHVLVSKYVDHLPLNRQENIYLRFGVHLTRQTLCDWVGRCADLVTPLYVLLKQEVLQSAVIGTDDTPVSVLDENRTQTRESRLWVYWGDVHHPGAVYAYSPNHEQHWPQEFLAAYTGYLQADAYSGYDALYHSGRIVEVGCWAHTRRKFYEAQGSDPERALYVLGVIRELYQVETQAQQEAAALQLGLQATWDLRLAKRQQRSVPLLTSLREWLDVHKDQVLPKSPIAEAITYALNQWEALLRYTTVGFLEIDNNAAERALRAIAIGRKNYLFFGRDVGGERAAKIYTLTQTCQRLGIEPWRYLRDVLERLPTTPVGQLPELLPQRWAQRQQAALAETPPPGG
jgi:transposase